MDKIEQEIEQMAETLEKAMKSGEGSRGGKIIGHTRSGKPIYDVKSEAAHRKDIAAAPQGEKVPGSKKDEHHKEYGLNDHIDAFAHHAVKRRASELNDHKERNKHDRGERYHDEKIGEMTNGHKFTDEHKAYAAESKAHYEKEHEHEKSAQSKTLRDEWAGLMDKHKKTYGADGKPETKPEHPEYEKDRKRMHEIAGKLDELHPLKGQSSEKAAHFKDGKRVEAEETQTQAHEDEGMTRSDAQGVMEAKEMKARMKKEAPMKKGFEGLMETVMEMGPEALRKAIPNLTDDQKLLLEQVLVKAKDMPKAAMGAESGQELIELASEKGKQKKRRADEDDKLVEPANAEIKHQGDDSEQKGTLIKAENVEEKLAKCEAGCKCEKCMNMNEKVKKSVAEFKAAKLEKAEVIAACEKRDPELAKAMAKEWDKDEVMQEKAEKPAPMAADGKKMPIGEEADAEGESEELETQEKASGKDLDGKHEAKFGKSVKWSNGTQDLLKASTRRGQNAHYQIEDYLLKSEAERTEILAKGGYLNETGAAEELAKSNAAQRKVSVNDILEKGLDLGEKQLDNAQLLAKAKPSGAFSVKSFAEADLAKSLGMTVEEAAKVLLGKK